MLVHTRPLRAPPSVWKKGVPRPFFFLSLCLPSGNRNNRDRGFPVRAYCRFPPHRPARLEKAPDSDTEVSLRLPLTLAGFPSGRVSDPSVTAADRG